MQVEVVFLSLELEAGLLFSTAVSVLLLFHPSSPLKLMQSDDVDATLA